MLFLFENKIVYAQTLERSFPTDFTLDELKKFWMKNVFPGKQTVYHQFRLYQNIHTSPNYKVELQAQPAEEITGRERVKDFKIGW